MGTYYLLLGIIALISWMVSSTLKRKFAKYSKTHLRNGMSGAEIAEKMLADHGINNVRVVSVKGRLTDHYNPKDRTVNLSEAVYHERNAAAAAVAAHECGHAVQHAQAYSWLQMRSSLVPVVNISSRLSMWIIFAGLMLGFGAGLGLGYWVVVLGFGLMAVATVFSFVTLPVEYDASNRALAWLQNKNMLSREEYKDAEDALKWAARTYLVAALGSLATLMYWALQIFGRD
ncbi:zinc metallopeptidase [Flavobacteriaceae bacterium]|nr:zinc metallopeptidase [Flavobacteriaceae bacterium]